MAESGFCLSEFVTSGVFVEAVLVSSALTAFAPNRRAVPKRTLAAPKLYLRIESAELFYHGIFPFLNTFFLLFKK